MDSTLFHAAITGDMNVISSYINDKSSDEILQLRVSNSYDTILHLASEYGHTEAVNDILSLYPLLLSEVNSEGNSALHLAARAGYVDVASALVKCRKDRLDVSIEDQQDILMLTNKEEDTAVHEAAKYNRIKVVDMLLKEDPNVTYSCNKWKEDPLYLAASRGFHDLVDLIITSCPSPSYDGPYRRTALHAAVMSNSKDCTTRLLKWNKSLVQSKDEYEQTPLHYAAELGFGNLVCELLSVDPSSAYIVNGKGRNMLHIAVEHDQRNAIKYLLKECPWLINSLITKKDNDGNTPLHLLAISECLVRKLIHHPMGDKGAINYNGMTPLALLNHEDKSKSSAPTTKNEIAEELIRAGAISNIQTRLPFSRDEVRAMVENHMIVAALIATVAFTAVFAMPGGYIQSGSSNQGMAVLSRNSIAFQAFVISNAMALFWSTSSLFIYFLITAYSKTLKEKTLVLLAIDGINLNMFGLGAIVLAFTTGTYAVLQYYSHGLAIAICVLGVYVLTGFIYSAYTRRTAYSMRTMQRDSGYVFLKKLLKRFVQFRFEAAVSSYGISNFSK